MKVSTTIHIHTVPTNVSRRPLGNEQTPRIVRGMWESRVPPLSLGLILPDPCFSSPRKVTRALMITSRRFQAYGLYCRFFDIFDRESIMVGRYTGLKGGLRRHGHMPSMSWTSGIEAIGEPGPWTEHGRDAPTLDENIDLVATGNSCSLRKHNPRMRSQESESGPVAAWKPWLGNKPSISNLELPRPQARPAHEPVLLRQENSYHPSARRLLQVEGFVKILDRARQTLKTTFTLRAGGCERWNGRRQRTRNAATRQIPSFMYNFFFFFQSKLP
ncbi:hypothetical protein LZ31DRAFT_140569 [Colletotrichum somersetense]|nr:hypothetical protein LZ31DRAFT_140569 [Colletotrichum somersetense]